jgi:hypothetical protein
MTVRYTLDWPALDLDRIRAAAEPVAGSFPNTKVEVMGGADEAHLSCFFIMPATVARQYEARGSFDELLAYTGGQLDEDLCVEVTFSYRPADGDEPACCDFVFDTAGNRLCSGVGREVAERLAKVLGGRCALE